MNIESGNVKRIFLEALEICPSDAWGDFLDRRCGGNQELRTQVETLLEAHTTDDSFLDAGAFGQSLTVDEPVVEQLGRTIGHYKLLQKIGEGGFGVVYMAEQQQPVRRKVALKIIKPGMDTKSVVARFEAERQALAMMDHPHVAKVLDANATDEGRPYFVMELVHGVPITDFCDQQKLSTDKRLRLFMDVCRAVQHAHQKGIIHRDLKPSNVMITMDGDRPLVKVIDFGVAKALDQQLTEKTLFTAYGQMVGTPMYMSPEQAQLSAVDVDTRSDVYSLGVLLYELLTGTTPFDEQTLKEAGFDEMRRMIREDEPLRPSAQVSTLDEARLSTISDKRQIEPRKLRRLLRGELDWVLMKCLEKVPSRRYETANGLARDIERYLHDEAVEASPPSTAYRLQKFAERNRWVLGTSAVISFSLVGWAVGGILYGVEQGRQAERMAALALKAEQSRLQAEEDRQASVEQRNRAQRNQYYAEMVAGPMYLASQNQAGLYTQLINQMPVSRQVDYRDWEWHYLMSHCHPELRNIVYPGWAPVAAWSPDGQLFGAPGEIWRADTGERIRRFNTSYTAHLCAAWSPDGNKFAWGMTRDESCIYIWDRSSENVSRLAGHKGSVHSIAWSPDGTQIASGSMDLTFKVWDVATGTVQWTSPELGEIVAHLAWSPDGKLLVADTRWNGVQVWDAWRRELAVEPETGKKHWHALSWHPDGEQLAICENDSWYVLHRDDWSVKYRQSVSRAGRAIAYSPDGSKIAVAHGESVTILNADGETKLAELRGHRYPVISISWHPDGHRLVTADNARSIKLWDLARPQQPRQIETESEIQSIVWLDDNETLMTVAQGDGSSAWWDARDGSLERREESVITPPFQLSSDRRLAAVPREEEHAIEILDSANGATRSVLRLGDDRTLNSYALSRDGSRLVTQSETDGELILDFWNADEEQRVGNWHTWNYPFTHFVWNKDGDRVAASGSGDFGDDGGQKWQSHLHVFDAINGQRVLKRNPEGRGPITCISWSRDGRHIALGTSEGRVEVVGLKGRTRRFSRKLHYQGITALAWHPHGNRVACATRNGGVNLLSSADGQLLLTLSLAAGRAIDLAWSSDGRQLAAATSEGHIQIWDAGRAYEISTTSPRQGELAWMYFERAEQSNGELAEAALRNFLHHAPDRLGFWKARGSAYANLGQFERAFEEYSKGIEPVQYAFKAARDRTYALLGARNVERYRRVCVSLVDAFQDSPVPSNRGEIAWLCALAPNSLVDSAEIVRMAQHCLDANRDDRGDYWRLTLGACLHRHGKHDEAVRVLSELATDLDRHGNSTDRFELACTQYFLALARFEMDHVFQARRLLQAANRTADQYPRHVSYWYWNRPVVLAALRSEAEDQLFTDDANQHSTYETKTSTGNNLAPDGHQVNTR